MSQSSSVYLSTAIKGYFSSYSGLPAYCWQRIWISFIEATFMGISYFLSLYFVNELNFTVANAGIIMSFYGFGTIVGGLLGGKLSDRISPETVSIISLFFQAIGFLVLIKLSSFSLLIIDLFILGVGSYGFITSNHLCVLNQCKDYETQRLKALNILSVASNLGIGVSAIIVSSLTNYGFVSILSISSLLLTLSAIYLFFMEIKNMPVQNIDELQEDISGRQKAFDIKNKQANKNKENKVVFWLVLGCLFLVGFIISQTNSTYSIYLQELFPQLGIKAFSILLMLNTFIVVLFQAPMGNFSGHKNKILVVGIGAFLLGFGICILNFSFIFIIAVLACIVETIGEMLFFSAAQLVCYEKGGENKKGHSLGLYRMIYASSRVVGPAVGGIVYTQLGAKMLWYFCGLLGVLCLTTCNYYKKYD